MIVERERSGGPTDGVAPSTIQPYVDPAGSVVKDTVPEKAGWVNEVEVWPGHVPRVPLPWRAATRTARGRTELTRRVGGAAGAGKVGMQPLLKLPDPGEPVVLA